MRFPAFAILAVIASGCTIHVVEQPATPTLVTEAPRPPRVRSARPHPIVHVPTAAVAEREPVARPTTVAPPTPVATRTPFAARPDRGRPHVTTPARRPFRIPFKTLPPETRSPQLVSAPRPTNHHRPPTAKHDRAIERVSSTDIAKTQ